MRRDAARNRELLIESAREVFARRGLDATLDDVAEHAGVGVGTAYRHFANKFELAVAVTDDVMDGIVAAARTAAEGPDPWAGLVGFLEAVLDVQTRDRGLREVMLGVHDQCRADAVHDRMSGQITRLLDRAKQAGAVRPEAQTSDLGFLLMMLCQVADVAGDVDREAWRRYLPTLLTALRPDGPPLPGVALTEEQFRTASASLKAGRAATPHQPAHPAHASA